MYTNYTKQEMREEITAFLYYPKNNRFRNYDKWICYVYQNEDETLAGFIDIGLVCAKNYKELLNHFKDTDYYNQINNLLISDKPIPVVEPWYVDEKQRGFHIGEKLMSQAEKWVEDNGYSFILSDTDGFRDVSKRIHNLYGYVEYCVDSNDIHYHHKYL
ncbi:MULTISPECIES: GNAT family N-acetyltransferase [unclassified Breznakia]|uniref:GNAT family N-acetyltransferase n=1 Tax=unclassified Breznakia TaxID=2623764 RepID=UPI002405C717|nr:MULTISPECIES: GNAT family N-acetyltransferase [unclassified Breznakia]MDF9859200.1 GNAT superfamily N-acetyltransferase [Breznakia sp. PH5-24]